MCCKNGADVVDVQYMNPTKGFSILHFKTSESIKALLDGQLES
jgi:hypothetical protein